MDCEARLQHSIYIHSPGRVYSPGWTMQSRTVTVPSIARRITLINMCCRSRSSPLLTFHRPNVHGSAGRRRIGRLDHAARRHLAFSLAPVTPFLFLGMPSPLTAARM
ncbi:hypothetical protein LX36DRAFT_280246 [Colletotrichum falcatum]|nr:hypothetical protein LX36DRAFT_280246 [Colletotrichum falcatum]